MSVAWRQMPKGNAAAIAAAIAATVPAMETARLKLRAPKISDFAAYEAVFTSDRARHIGGPFSQEGAYADFCEAVAGWMLRGAGMWTLTLQDNDAPLGWVYLWQEIGDPEPELGWIVTEAAEGKGYAGEAARAVLPHALDLYGPQGFVSYIDADNHRSARLASSLGAVRDIAAEVAMAALGETDLHVYRHSGTGTPL